ncbi:hypothetical protein SEA_DUMPSTERDUDE_44 [Gordonia phage DumpsterDude]|uniref:Uncharacterized protein n=1 Tax=Gordonia phage DumpsterDude TaxID=2713262 RepID=A0A6G8R0B5_9CAUD|nr:hypothetical protein JZX77_gp44 [Gordonia phage DumpsterDude]QIN93632.1 hypothetical protein SEA_DUMPSTERDUDE_44 [Gordonia phage DumpsterDude]
MPRRTMTVTEVWAHPVGSRKEKDRVDLTALPDGMDLLHAFYGFAADVDARQLLKRENESFASVVSLEEKGRAVTLAVDVGRFGERGTITDVTTMIERDRFTRTDAISVITHGIFTLPKGCTSALVFIERSGNQSGIIRVLELFQHQFRLAYPDLILETTAVVESEAWLSYASLVKVSAHRRASGSDEADNNSKRIKRSEYGELAHTLVPARGERTLPRFLYDRLVAGALKPSELLDFDESDEAAHVEVTLEHNGQRKTFLLGHEKRPSISYLLSNHGEDEWSLERVRDYAFDTHADTIYGRLGWEWTPAHTVGAWTDSQRGARLVVRGGEQS